MDLHIKPIKRSSTEEILDKLSNSTSNEVSPNAIWYTPGVDFCFYAPAQDACVKSRDRLDKLKLQSDELDLLDSPVEPEKVVEKIKEIQAELEKKSTEQHPSLKRASEFMTSFCTFADKTSGLVNLLLPQSPEYTVTFGMLFILFKAVATRKDREKSLVTHIESIGSRLPLAEFYKSVFPTNAMKAAVARVYVHIMKLLDEAVVYYRSWRLKQLVDAVLQPNSKFDEYITKIDAEIRNMNELKDAGHIAQTADMMDMISGTGLLMARLYQNFENQSSAIGTSMDILNSKLDDLTLQTGYLLRFEMVKHARSLQEILLAGGRDPEEELETAASQEVHLSQRDHWENNGILEDLGVWSQNHHSLLLWVGGTSGSRESWVTEMSTDLVLALQPRLVTPLFVFCGQHDSEHLTPLTLVRRLLVQLLDLHPEIAYQRPELCNTWKFQKSVTFSQVWRIFQQLAARIPGLFIVIDRVEECQADEQADLVHQLLPALISLAEKFPNVSIIVTSIFEPPSEVDGLPFYSSYIDTSRRANRR